MLVIAGLGNPGARYARNRHNIGFMAVDAIAERGRFGPFRARHQGLAADGLIGEERVMLLKPQTYMNESGRSVGEALRYMKLGLSALVVIHDELDLAPGQGEDQGRRRRRRPQRPALDHRPPGPRLQAGPDRHWPSRRQGARLQLCSERLCEIRGRMGRSGLARRSPMPRRSWSPVRTRASRTRRISRSRRPASARSPAPDRSRRPSPT